MDDARTCTKCGETKSSDLFCRERDRRCKACIAEIHRDWRRRNPDTVKAIEARRAITRKPDLKYHRLTAEQKEQKRIALALRYHKKKLLGECTACPEKAILGTTKCAVHAIDQRRKARARVEKLKNLDICLRCGGSPKVNKNHCAGCRKKINEEHFADRQQRVHLVLDHYGRACACCGEKELMFLTLDHMNDNGMQHRRETGWDTYRILRKQFRDTGVWPEGYQILCYNCNSGRWRNGGECPHKGERKKITWKEKVELQRTAS